MRHFIPILTLLSVAASITIADRISRLENKRLRSITRSCLIIISCLYLVYAAGTAKHAYNSQGLGEKFLKGSPTMIGLEKFIHKNIPQNARILFLNGHQTLFMDREVINENLLGVKQVRNLLLLGKTKRIIRETLLENGFEYMLIQKNLRQHFPNMFKLLLKDPHYVKTVYKNPSFVLYELTDPVEKQKDNSWKADIEEKKFNPKNCNGSFKLALLIKNRSQYNRRVHSCT